VLALVAEVEAARRWGQGIIHAGCRGITTTVSIRRTRLRIVLVLVAAENDDEDDPEAALPRVYSYNVTTP
jgi:hypothetical protein